MELSKRMETVVSMVTKGNKIADIGTDHGYVPIALVERGWVRSAIAMDVKKGPLKKAQMNIKEHQLEQKITTRLSNGLEKLQKGEVETVIIAGMGGALTAKILEEGSSVLSSFDELILQPQSEIYKVREQLHNMGFQIEREEMLIEENKYYTVIKAKVGTEQYERKIDYLYGKNLLDTKNEVLFSWLLKEGNTCKELLEKLETVQSENARERKEELLQKEQLLKEALAEYETV